MESSVMGAGAALGEDLCGVVRAGRFELLGGQRLKCLKKSLTWTKESFKYGVDLSGAAAGMHQGNVWLV